MHHPASEPDRADWQARCAAHGLSMTAPRRAILAALLELEQPGDAVTLLQATKRHHPGAQIGTVYRFLRELERAGLARAWAQPHGRMRWQLQATAPPTPSATGEVHGLLQQVQTLLRELDRLGLAESLLAPPVVPRQAGHALELLGRIAEQLGYQLLPAAATSSIHEPPTLAPSFSAY